MRCGSDTGTCIPAGGVGGCSVRSVHSRSKTRTLRRKKRCLVKLVGMCGALLHVCLER